MYSHRPQQIKIIPASELKVGMFVALSCSCGKAFHEVQNVTGDIIADKWGGQIHPSTANKKGWLCVKLLPESVTDCREEFSILPNATATIKVY